MENRHFYAPSFNSFLLIIEYYSMRLFRDLLYRFPLSFYCLMIDISESIMNSCENRKKRLMDYLQLSCKREKNLSFSSLLFSLKTIFYIVAVQLNYVLEKVSSNMGKSAQDQHRQFMIRFMSEIENGTYPFMSIPEIKRNAFCYLPAKN